MTEDEKKKWLFFWIVVSLFVLFCLLTAATIFFGLGNMVCDERSTLIKLFFGEVSALMGSLFVVVFKLKSNSELKDIKILDLVDIINKLRNEIKR